MKPPSGDAIMRAFAPAIAASRVDYREFEERINNWLRAGRLTLDQHLGPHCHRLSNWTPANGGLTCYETWRGS